MYETVVGIDPSLSSSGIIVINREGQIVSNQTIKSPPSGSLLVDRMLRIEKIVREVMQIVSAASPSVICIEAYSLGSNMPGVAARVELGGLLRYALFRATTKIYEVAPTTLKKWATGKGNCEGKIPVVVALMKRYQVEFSSDDLYDAYALARIAFQIAEFGPCDTELQGECVTTITTPKVPKPKKVKARG